ncbi:MAG: cyclophilin-like fold protein [Lachnospiraceae bacterium]|nr:cyclophilin-like fold protein [Ruminococcus sp.]MCM1276366.1 cyclophilin-like fold protein [Lachnospiraceae bacterium]
MKKLFACLTAFAMIFSLAGCNGSEPNSALSESVSSNTSESEPQNSAAVSSVSDNASDTTPTETGENIPITLTAGDTVLNGYLYDSTPAKSLAAQLPITVSLNDSDNDFCGGNLNIEYSENDVTSGYKNGDLDFWTPANNFVIFVSGGENSANTGDLVNLGRITDPQSALDKLEGRLDVTIALSNNADNEQTSDSEISDIADETSSDTESSNTGNEQTSESSDTDIQEGEESMKVKITVGNTVLYATFEDNSTARALMAQMPMTLKMNDLYGREMCYRYDAGALSTDNLHYDGYEIGDIAYWPPRGSLVILYDQNGEEFERQQIGHIDSGVEIFESMGDTDVTFEIARN